MRNPLARHPLEQIKNNFRRRDTMTDTTDTPKADAPGNADKPVDAWVTGDEMMTGAQASYLKTLCEEAGEPFDPDLSKADASKAIDRLQESTGRGTG